VWKATDIRLDRLVAINFLPEAVPADPDRIARFAREAKPLAALSHPMVPKRSSWSWFEGPTLETGFQLLRVVLNWFEVLKRPVPTD
jgi:serine/threonine protein kinase